MVLKLSLPERWLANPVVLKELRGRMRGNRAFVILTVYLVLMSALMALIYTVYMSSSETLYYQVDQNAGKVLFLGVAGVELFLVCFIAPSLTAGAISGEREKQTYDLLRTTLLTARALVLGKLASALSFIYLLIFAALPLLSMAFLLGGVTVAEVAITVVLLIATALAFGAWGLFFSVLMKRTLGASVLTYGFVIFVVVALPVILVSVLLTIESASRMSALTEVLLFYGTDLLACFNPILAGVLTEAILLDKNELFISTINVRGFSLVAVSPWWVYVLVSLLTSWVLTVLTTQLVRRKETT